MRDGSGDGIRDATAASRRRRGASLRACLVLVIGVVGAVTISGHAQSPDPASNDPAQQSPPSPKDPSGNSPPSPKDPSGNSPQPGQGGQGGGNKGNGGGAGGGKQDAGGQPQPQPPKKPQPQKPPEPPKPDATPRPGVGERRESLPVEKVFLPWVASASGGGNATLVRDIGAGATYLFTTIDALGFRSGERTVKLRLYDASGPGNEGLARLVAEAPDQVDCYGFRVLPIGHPLAGLCVHRLSERAAEALVRQGTLCFVYDGKAAGQPPLVEGTASAKTRHLAFAGQGMQWHFLATEANFARERATISPSFPGTASRGAPLFATASLPDGPGESVDMLLGMLDAEGRGDVRLLQAWDDMRELLDEGRTVALDDARALADYLPRHWDHRDGYRNMIGWSRENQFMAVAFWRSIALDEGGTAEFPYLARHLQAGRRPDERMICAVSETPGDDITVELSSGSHFGQEEHPAADGAVALRDAHEAQGIKARFIRAKPANRGAGTQVLVIETAKDLPGRPLGMIPDPARN